MARVATAGTVQATASNDKLDNDKADTGAWAPPLKVVETTDKKLTVGGNAVVHNATGAFTFTGSKGNTTVTDASKVTLNPQRTTLESGQVAVLLDGDSAHDSFGNTLTVKVPAVSKLSSS
jgi:hypothetical protein